MQRLLCGKSAENKGLNVKYTSVKPPQWPGNIAKEGAERMLRTQQDGEEFRETLSSVNEHTAAIAIYTDLHK